MFSYSFRQTVFSSSVLVQATVFAKALAKSWNTAHITKKKSGIVLNRNTQRLSAQNSNFRTL